MKKDVFLLLIGLMFGMSISAQNYYVYATAESEDEVAIVKFDGVLAKAVKTIPVGVWPAEIEGPHGITISPDGKYWYLTLAHGNPFGTLYKFSTETNELLGQTKLGLFPASMQISTATGLLYCVNFNLHGDMIPSTVSVVDPETMTELKRITTGAMPHGSRISADGTKHYSVAMMSGELFEIDALRLKVNRVLSLDGEMNKGHEDHEQHNQHQAHGSAMNETQGMKHSMVKPTWVIPHPHGGKVYVAANGVNKVLEVDLKKWAITNEFLTGKGPYNVEISPDGNKMVVTYKSEGTTGIWDLSTGKELAKITNSRKVSHGVAITPDSKYAFISAEGIGGEPGAVDVISLDDLTLRQASRWDSFLENGTIKCLRNIVPEKVREGLIFGITSINQTIPKGKLHPIVPFIRLRYRYNIFTSTEVLRRSMGLTFDLTLEVTSFFLQYLNVWQMCTQCLQNQRISFSSPNINGLYLGKVDQVENSLIGKPGI